MPSQFQLLRKSFSAATPYKALLITIFKPSLLYICYKCNYIIIISSHHSADFIDVCFLEINSFCAVSYSPQIAIYDILLKYHNDSIKRINPFKILSMSSSNYFLSVLRRCLIYILSLNAMSTLFAISLLFFSRIFGSLYM